MALGVSSSVVLENLLPGLLVVVISILARAFCDFRRTQVAERALDKGQHLLEIGSAKFAPPERKPIEVPRRTQRAKRAAKKKKKAR